MKKYHKKKLLNFFIKNQREDQKDWRTMFLLYIHQKKIKLRPGETKIINMCVKITFSKNVTGSCRILQSLTNYRLKLLNSNTISQEFNSNIQNFLTVYENDLPGWILIFELINKNFNRMIEIRKRQEIGYFFIINNAGKEIDFKYKKEL